MIRSEMGNCSAMFAKLESPTACSPLLRMWEPLSQVTRAIPLSSTGLLIFQNHGSPTSQTQQATCYLAGSPKSNREVQDPTLRPHRGVTQRHYPAIAIMPSRSEGVAGMGVSIVAEDAKNAMRLNLTARNVPIWVKRASGTVVSHFA